VCGYPGGNTTQGVCDIVGNVYEWVLDEYHSDYNGAPANEQAWCSDIGVCNTNTSRIRVGRGGAWTIYEFWRLRSTSRYESFSPSTRYSNLGFRVSRSIP
jgi:formylglycine-generating enzyme required for sulfatase activity